MPKAIIEFNLPDEQSEYELANAGTNLSLALWDITQYLRGIDKYGFSESDEHFKTPESTIEHIREKIYEIIQEHNVNQIING